MLFKDSDIVEDMQTEYVSGIEQLLETLSDETVEDVLQFVQNSDLPFLDNEFLSNGDENDALLRQWLKLRKDTSEYQNYISTPVEERTPWSAWYLRHIKNPESK
ncbi:hypothetical protein STCU_01570 [Strigomonas culicis]|nr:hypothetical protein STCU_01570 [Strigomonas culicis]|eukprot:EPY34466.1 hypothetical protein STCU_01570 [Strigomonas culicis]